MDPTDKLFQSLRSKKSEEEKYKEIVEYLEQGANVNAIDAKKKNNTPLHIAVQNSDSKIVELLLNKNANVTLKNDLNQNPLELAKSLPEVDDDVVALLNAHNQQAIVIPKVSEDNKNEDEELLSHEKREGTASGLSGQFYETKLLSLILFRCLTDETIKKFYLGTNVKNVGDLDDVCLKYVLGEDKPKMLFIQAKHRDQRTASNNITIDDLKNSDDFKLTKYFDSYKKIKEKFQNDSDIMFKGAYEDVECDFVIFTPSNNTIPDTYKTNSIALGQHRFEKLFCSRDNLDNIFAIPKFNNIHETFQIKDERLLLDQIELQHVDLLSGILITCLLNDNEQTFKNMMTIDLIKKYHVVLARKVIDVANLTEATSMQNVLEDGGEGTSKSVSLKLLPISSTESEVLGDKQMAKYREGKFRPDFFHTKDKTLRFLREKMFKDKSKTEIEKFKSNAFSFKLPKCFGNIDLTVHENVKKGTKRIDYLARTIIKLANIFKETKVIKIDDNIFINTEESNKENQINMGFVDNDGGIAGLVGNLLLIDDESKMFHIKDSEENIQANSRRFLYNLKNKFKEHFGDENFIFQFKFDIDINNFPKLSFDCDEREKLLARDYLSKLWFLTNQCQHNELQTIVKTEMEGQYRKDFKNRLLQIQSDAIFLKFHEKIQDWWMKKRTSYYLTSNCDFYEKSKLEIIDSPILNVLNFTIKNNIRKYEYIKFNNEAINMLGLEPFLNDTNSRIFNIISNESILTVLKLSQFFENNENKLYNETFLDFEYILENGYYEMMQSELQMTKLHCFIFIQKKEESIQKLCEIIANTLATCDKKVIIVSENNISNAIKSQCDKECVSQIDDKCDLNDIFENETASRDWSLIFQGQEIKFNRIVEGESKRLVNSHILVKLINNETIEIGKPLANRRYDEVKQYCIPRNLTRGEEYEIRTFKDINENVVLIASEPGMGKTVLMNQLALQTKEIEHNSSETSSWIVFVSLRDYSSEFKRWKEENIHITKNEALRFICKTAIDKLSYPHNEKKLVKGQRHNLNAFKIKIENEDIQLKSFTKDNKVAFELQLFIDYYNNGNVIFIFDGFDEICPQYEKQVGGLLKELSRSYHLANCELLNPMSIAQNAMSFLKQKALMSCDCPKMGLKQQRIWVTTRSYQNIKNAIETELGRTAFTLKPLSKMEQMLYLMGYFEIHFNILDLTVKDAAELNEFLDYMLTALSDESKHIAMVSVPLYTVYVTAVKYLQAKFSDDSFGDISVHISNIRNKCADVYSVLTSFGPVFERQKNIRELSAVSENPLHLYMAAEYFYSQIKEHKSDERQEKIETPMPKKWDVNAKSFDLFEKFLDTKFRKIRFEEKNEVDTSRSDNEMTLQREKIDFVEKHKKMALFAIFDRKDLKQLLPERFLDESDEIMIKINEGEEKTGVIVTVIDRVPRFVHLVFAEYFAIEYIGDLLKNACKSVIEQPSLEELWRFIMNIVLYKSTGGVRTFFDHKLRNDSDLMDLITSEQSKRIVFESLIKQGRENQVTPEGFSSLFTILRTSLNVAVEESLFDIQNFIFECIKSSLNEENVDEFTEITANSLLAFSALGASNENLIYRMKSCLSELPNGKDKFIDMMMPTFAKQMIPFKLSPETIKSVWNMLSSTIPQLSLVDLDTAPEITPRLRYAIMDYVRFLWDLITDAYRF